jgi:hypothetical protein
VIALAMACLAATQRGQLSVDLVHKYRAYAHDFVDEDLPKPPPPKPLEPMRSNAEWYKMQPQYQNPKPETSEANRRRAELYRAIDFAIKNGGF